MCYFINIGLPKGPDIIMLNQLPDQLSYFQSNNKCFIDALPNNYSSYYIIMEFCSCGLFDPEYGSDSDTELNYSQRQKKKYQKKGWSEHKINRALEDINKNKTENQYFKYIHGLDKDLWDWLVMYKYEYRKQSFYLHIREYRGDQNKVKFDNSKSSSFKIGYIKENFKIPENKIVQINV